MAFITMNQQHRTSVVQTIDAEQIDTDRVHVKVMVGYGNNGVSINDFVELEVSSMDTGATQALKTKLAELAELLARYKGVIP